MKLKSHWQKIGCYCGTLSIISQEPVKNFCWNWSTAIVGCYNSCYLEKRKSNKAIDYSFICLGAFESIH